MLVIGEKTVYLSHLPMFQDESEREPMIHRYQAILEVIFKGKDSDPQLRYVRDRQAHRTTKIYMLNPEQFVLRTLASTDSQHALRSFKATLFRGHFERPRKVAVLLGIEVAVKRVIHFREFDPKTKKLSKLEYLLFGKGQELFLAHLIMAPPDFDQVLAVKVTGHQFTDEELARGVQIAVGATNTPATRLKEKQRIAGEIKMGSTSAPKEVQVEVTTELYFEEGELRVPATFDPTPEEKRAGFP